MDKCTEGYATNRQSTPMFIPRLPHSLGMVSALCRLFPSQRSKKVEGLLVTVILMTERSIRRFWQGQEITDLALLI